MAMSSTPPPLATLSDPISTATKLPPRVFNRLVAVALDGLGAGVIALRYPGILYWGFTNVEEILHTGKTASAPGIWILTQLAASKVVTTTLCKGSGLVGGLYAPSLMIGVSVINRIDKFSDSGKCCCCSATGGNGCYGVRRYQSRMSPDMLKSDSILLDESSCLISFISTREIIFHGRTRGLLTCYPDTTLLVAKELMEAKDRY